MRLRGHIAHIGQSRSGGFWVVIKAGPGRRSQYFAHGLSFLSHPTMPRIGQQCLFTPLPRGPLGRLNRATEIAIQQPGGKVQATHVDGVVRLVLRYNRREREVGQINLANV